MRPAVLAVGGIGTAVAIAAGYVGVVTGALPIDLNIGRRVRPLEQIRVDIRAPREVVFDIITAGYAPRRPKALVYKIDVLERGHDMVLAAHRTPVRDGLTAVTTETVRFTRPDRVDFRLVRGPVPHVVESFVLSETSIGTRLDYHGELGTDLWAIGEWWGRQVSAKWEAAVKNSGSPGMNVDRLGLAWAGMGLVSREFGDTLD